MYRVYADGELLYSPEITQSEYFVTSAKFVTELNKAGSLDIVLPPTHKFYNSLKHLQTDMSVEYVDTNGEESNRFYGRVLTSDKDYYNNRTIMCEGDLAFLNDSVQRPFSFVQKPDWAFRQFVNRHNGMVKPDRQFIMGVCDMSTDSVAYDASSYGKSILIGTIINHTSTTGETVQNSDVSLAEAGVLYLNRNTYRLYKCTVGGIPTEVVWVYVGNVRSVTGTVSSSNNYLSGTEVTGMSRTPTEARVGEENLQVGDVYINNETFYVYRCTNNEEDLWVYLGTIAPMINATDLAVSSGAIFYSKDSYETTMSIVTDVLVDSVGGYLYTSQPSRGGSGRMIHWTRTPGVVANQIIRFGENLLDLSEHISAENIVTCVIPHGDEVHDSEGNDLGYKVDVRAANSGIDYIQSSIGVDLFGKIWREVEFEGCSTPKRLKDAAEAYLDENIKLALTIELTAFDLSLIDIDADDIVVGNMYRVVSEPHGIDNYFVCSKAEVNLLQPDQSRFTFGAAASSLTGVLNSKSNFVTAADAPVYIKSSETYWLVNEDPEAKPDVHDDAWSTDTPTWSSTTYVWQKTVDTYSDGTIKESDPICLTGHHGESTISVTITSSAGDMFLRRDINTILTCDVYYGTKDWSDHVTSYHWVKKDKDGNVDDTWSRMPGKSISITSEDVNTKAIFDCEVTLVI